MNYSTVDTPDIQTIVKTLVQSWKMASKKL